MMKKSTIFFLSTFIMNAQKDTLYFDNNWKETSAENGKATIYLSNGLKSLELTYTVIQNMKTENRW